MAKYCFKCGAQLEDDNVFCSKCGARQNQTEQEQSQNVYQAPPTPDYQNAGANMNFNAPIQERSIPLYIILSIVTCGIFGLYWIYSMATDVNTASNRTNDFSGGMVILLSIVTCGIFMFYWLYTAGDKLNIAKAQRGIPGDSNAPVIYLILGIVGLSVVSYALIQNELNKMATVR